MSTRVKRLLAAASKKQVRKNRLNLESLEDRCTPAVISVLNTYDGGAGSLRQAILDSNASVGVPDTIAFAIPNTDAGYHAGRDAFVIAPGSNLPEITDPVVIDGYTQAGSSPNTLPNGNNAVLRIELNGSNVAGTAIGLFVTGGNSTIRGLSIYSFTGGIQLGYSNQPNPPGGSVVEGNFLGTDVTGLVRKSNAAVNVYVINSNNNRVGTNADGVNDPGERNLIIGASHGVWVKGSGPIIPSNNVIAGNFIGTDRTGTVTDPDGIPFNSDDFGNSHGITIEWSSSTTIGGTTATARNIISGNYFNGIAINGTGARGATGSEFNVVQGNYIGTDVTGTLSRGNGFIGVNVASSEFTTIGGTAPGARNIISGNGIIGGTTGLLLDSTYSTTVQGNYIGTDVTGTLPLGNVGNTYYLDGDGIKIQVGADNLIGGTAPGAGNLIAYNQGAGVMITANSFVSTSSGNTVRGNSIHSNGGLGIDIAPQAQGAAGVTGNDAGDLDDGPNGFQNFPLIASAASNAGGTTISGTLNSTPSTTFTLDFYANSTTDPSGYGEGKTYLGSTTVTTDATGNASFNVTVSGVAPVGSSLSATATNAAGSTSEFSGLTTVVLSNATPFNLQLNSGTISENGTFTLTGSFDDPDTGNTHTVTINWGEGLPETYTLPAGARTFSFSHQYRDDSPSVTASDAYTIGVSVSDGTAAVSSNTSVTVNNVAPTNLNWNVTTPNIQENGTATVTGSFVDAGTQDVHTVTINWGDGAPVSYTLPVGARTFTITHQYTDDNPTGTASDRYRIRLTLTDDDSGTGSTAIYGLKSRNPAGTTAVSSPPTHLYQFNSDGTGFTDIGIVHLSSTNIDVDGLAHSPTLGLLAFQMIHPTASTAAVDSQLVLIDPTTAAATPIGSVLSGRVIRGAAFDANGRFWVVDVTMKQLLEIDPSNGQIVGTPVTLTLNGNPLNLNSSSDIAFRDDGTCFISSFREMYTLDMQTGAATLVFTDTAIQPSPNVVAAGAPAGIGMAFVDDTIFTYDAQGTDDIYSYDSMAGFTRQTVLLNIISSYNSGQGDLATLTRNGVVTVNNLNPEIDSLVASSQYGTGLVQISGTYHDTGSQDTHTITINWGEGSPETVTVTGGTFTASHQYANPNLNPSTTYTITAKLTDDDTGFSSKDATFLNSSFSGVAYHDINRDGILTGLEGPAPTRTIYLDSNNNGQLDSGEEFHITDAYGKFAFNNLPAGTYHIREVPLAHWVQTTPDIEFSVGSGETLTSGRVGNFRLANISGIKFHDLNGDGINSPGEIGMPYWTIFIDSNANGKLDIGEVSQTTDAFGAYHFDDLEAGSYTIREVQQSGWTLTSTNPSPFTIVPNLSAQEAWAAFGNFKYAKVSGGVLFNDGNGNGTRDPGEAGIGGRTVYIDLDNDGVRDPGETSTITDTNGNWGFDILLPGTYVIREATPTGWVSTGTPVTITVSQSGQTEIGGNLGSRLNTGTLSGFVWLDSNNNGDIDLTERAISNVTIQLIDASGNVAHTTLTDVNGYYEFTDLVPGTYKIREIQPEGYIDGLEDLGSLGGTVGSDQFSDIQVRGSDAGINYNFGERGVQATLHHGQTATIGFWQNKNGQNLIKSLNGGATSTALGNWLASNFGNLYGPGSGVNNLAGKTNTQIAEYYKSLFAQKGQKLQAQVFAVAIAVYVTDSDYAGTIAIQYGFEVNANGTGLATYNVGSNGAAFGVANHTIMSVLDILRATNARSSNGNVYNGNSALQNLANTVYDGINNTGDI